MDCITLMLPADLKYIRMASLAGVQTARILCVAVEQEKKDAFCHAFELALSEAFANCVKHGEAQNKEEQIVVTFELSRDQLAVTIKDHNPPFEYYRKSLPEPSEYPDSGFGLYLIHQVMDEVAYRRENGQNVMIMKKKI